MGLTMPKKEKIVVKLPDGTKAKVLVSMYDERNIIDFDKIGVKGLAPYDYRRYLDGIIKGYNSVLERYSISHISA